MIQGLPFYEFIHLYAYMSYFLGGGQGILTLFRKSGDQKDGGLLSQRIIFAELEFGFLLHEKISIASLQIWTYYSR